MQTHTLLQIIVLVVFTIVYFFIITEKINKVIVALLGASALILLQVFAVEDQTSQEGAFEFISNNLDVLGFIIGMMILIGVIKVSGFFDAVAVWLVKKIRGNPFLLLIVVGYLTLFMTMTLSNIPTVLILTPILLILIKQLKLPALPYLFTLVSMANIAGAATPISDPTTYYQATTVGLSFVEVVKNSGVIVMVLSVVTMAYILFIFKKDLSGVKVSESMIAGYNPMAAIKDRKLAMVGLAILVITILLIITKDFIGEATGVHFGNATLIFAAAFSSVLLFKVDVQKVFKEIIDWEIIFFFIGIFIVVGGLEHTGIIQKLSELVIDFTNGKDTLLLLAIVLGSSILSIVIDNVPYNITMVGAIKSMATAGIYVYPLWWALNLGTSIGGAGSLIGAACNVVTFGLAEKEGIHVKFMRYILLALPMVILNSLVTFLILKLRFM